METENSSPAEQHKDWHPGNPDKTGMIPVESTENRSDIIREFGGTTTNLHDKTVVDPNLQKPMPDQSQMDTVIDITTEHIASLKERPIEEIARPLGEDEPEIKQSDIATADLKLPPEQRN
jgi:hypothetical protein